MFFLAALGNFSFFEMPIFEIYVLFFSRNVFSIIFLYIFIFFTVETRPVLCAVPCQVEVSVIFSPFCQLVENAQLLARA
jgi:hypothetical protein